MVEYSFVGFSLLVLGMSLWELVPPLLQRLRWIPTTATVEGVRQDTERDSDGDEMPVSYARYRYAGPDGQLREGESRVPRSQAAAPGAPIDARVHPRDPARSVVTPTWRTREVQAGTMLLGMAVLVLTGSRFFTTGEIGPAIRWFVAGVATIVGALGVVMLVGAVRDVRAARATTTSATVLELAQRAPDGGGRVRLYADVELEEANRPRRRATVACAQTRALRVGDTVAVLVDAGSGEVRLAPLATTGQPLRLLTGLFIACVGLGMAYAVLMLD